MNDGGGGGGGGDDDDDEEEEDDDDDADDDDGGGWKNLCVVDVVVRVCGVCVVVGAGWWTGPKRCRV